MQARKELAPDLECAGAVRGAVFYSRQSVRNFANVVEGYLARRSRRAP